MPRNLKDSYLANLLEEIYIPRRHFLGDHLMLSICVEGAFPIRQHCGDDTRLTSGHCAVYGLSTGEDVATVYQSGEPLKWFTVFIERGSLYDLTGLRPADLPDNINQFLHAGTRLPLAALALSPATMLIARQIMECPFTAGFRSVYMKSKALELTCHVLFTLATNVQGLHRAGVQLSTRDQRKLQQAMALIDSNLEETPDIEKLVAAVGLSRPKLQLGFRVLYGDTVARIRDKRRMEHALKLVRTTHLSMVDIAAEVGYQHPASFTRAFKAAYGDAPLKLRRAAQHSTLLGHIGRRRV